MTHQAGMRCILWAVMLAGIGMAAAFDEDTHGTCLGTLGCPETGPGRGQSALLQVKHGRTSSLVEDEPATSLVAVGVNPSGTKPNASLPTIQCHDSTCSSSYEVAEASASVITVASQYN